MSEWKETEIGLIPKDWEILPLTKLIEFIVDNRGKTVPIVETKTSYPLIATNCIKESALFPVKENLRFLTEETYKTWFRGHPKHGDIIIVNKGTPGLVCFVPHPVDFCIAQDMVAIRINEKIYNKYLFAYMRSHFFKYQVNGLNVGTTIPHLKKANFKNINIPIPPKNYQKVSGDLYYILSLKIENLRKQNNTLEQIAQTLFKHWFIDFEFPNTDGKPYKTSGGEMQSSVLGDIPKGWRVGKLGDIYKTTSGGTPSRSEPQYYIEGTIPWVKSKELYSTFVLDTEEKITDSGFKNSSAKLLPKNSILIAMYGATVGQISILGIDASCNQAICAVIEQDYSNFFVYLWLQFKLKEWTGLAIGSAQQNLSQVVILKIDMFIPPIQFVREFHQLVSPTFEKILLNNKQIQTLTKTRDALLPKLMSGQIRIEE